MILINSMTPETGCWERPPSNALGTVGGIERRSLAMDTIRKVFVPQAALRLKVWQDRNDHD